MVLDNLEKKKAEKAARIQDLAVRQTEKKDLQDKLAAAKQLAIKNLAMLDAKVTELFLITKELGEAQDALLGLEQDLRDVELGSMEKKK